jgi:glucan-binding YG repeat protein
LKVVLGNLKEEGTELLSFLEPRVGTKPTLSGGTLEIDDTLVREGVKPRHVKTYIKRFLHSKGLRKKFRVLVSARELTVQELEVEEEKKEEKAKEPKEMAPTPKEAAEEPAKEEKREAKKEAKKAEAPSAEEKKEKPKTKKAAKPRKKKQKPK